MVREERNVEGALPMEVCRRWLQMCGNVEKMPRRKEILAGF